jgi:hypothetical protein
MKKCLCRVALALALTAHLFARNMRRFTAVASLLDGVAAFPFWLAYQWDLPVGRPM